MCYMLHAFGRSRTFQAAIVASLLMLGCPSAALSQDATDAPGTVIEQDTAAAFRIALEATERTHPFVDADSVLRFYERRGFQYAWTGNRTAERHTELVADILAQADDEGLDPTDYQFALNSLTSDSRSSVAERDILLSDTVLRYATHVRAGRVDPNEVSTLIELPTARFDPVSALGNALEGDALESFFTELPPPHEGYVRLRSELSHYRELERMGGWPELPAQSEIELSENDPRLPLLQDRLAIEYPELGLGAAASDVDALDHAVRLYQARNGLEIDGRVGSRTLEMLNVPVSRRIEQIQANMERWRWMPRRMEQRYIYVNIPDATLRVMEGNNSVLTSRVIVGNPRTPTPIFRADVTGVTANPPWNVPASIARNEMLPRLRSDRRYLADRNMILVNGPNGDPHGLTVDWEGISRSAFPYQIRQLPGEDNALGEIKLELPNRFSVFLHDTPARTLFSRMDRFLSHGCVRVQAIKELASYVLAQNSNHTPESLDEAIESGSTTLLRLNDRIPVYILYWTAATNPDGSFGFRRDVYAGDEQLLAAMDRRNGNRLAFQGELGCPMMG